MQITSEVWLLHVFICVCTCIPSDPAALKPKSFEQHNPDGHNPGGEGRGHVHESSETIPKPKGIPPRAPQAHNL